MSSGPKRGLKIGPILLAQTIVMPLLLVGADMVSDGGVLGQMWPYTMWAKFLAGAEFRKFDGNISRLAVNEERNMTVNERGILGFLFGVSIMILFESTWNLLRSNPLATLVRNARTTVMMNSRELERKDVPVPLGNK